jgi:hypothetical protein
MTVEVLSVEVFGPQMFLEALGCELALITDPAHVIAFLEFMPEEIGMTPITPPFVTQTNRDIQGIIQFTAESYIYIRTVYVLRGFHLDMLSHKEFDTVKVRMMAIAHFGATTYRLQLRDQDNIIMKITEIIERNTYGM